MKQQIRIKIHSLVDIITNSSSEIFCSIFSSKENILQIAEILSNVLGRKVEPDNYNQDFYQGEDDLYIDFWIEQGSESNDLIEDFRSMIKYILDNEIGEKNYKLGCNEI